MGAKAMQLKPNLLETENKSVSLQNQQSKSMEGNNKSDQLYWDKEIDGLSWYCYADSDIMTFGFPIPM